MMMLNNKIKNEKQKSKMKLLLLGISLLSIFSLVIWPQFSLAQTQKSTSLLPEMTFWKSHKALKKALKDRCSSPLLLFTVFIFNFFPFQITGLMSSCSLKDIFSAKRNPLISSLSTI